MDNLTTAELITLVRTLDNWIMDNQGSARLHFVEAVHLKIFDEYMSRPLLETINPHL